MGRHLRTKANRYRALDILLKGGQIRRESASVFSVRSQVTNDRYHKVKWVGKRWSCDCSLDEQIRRSSCEHIESVMLFLSLPSLLAMNLDPESFSCPQCGASLDNVTESGVQRNKSGPVQRFTCNDCGYRFNDRNGFNKLKNNPALIIIAVDLHFRGLSSREIEKHLNDVYGCKTDHVTVHRWTARFMKVLAKMESKLIASKKLHVGNRWHVDELVIKVAGRRAFLWAVLDHRTRYLLASIVSNSRSAQTAERVINLAIKRFGKTRAQLVSDGLASYSKTVKTLNGKGKVAIVHIAGKTFEDRVNNNTLERLNKTLRRRIRVSEQFQSINAANNFAHGYRSYYNLLRPNLAMNNNTPASKARFKAKHTLRQLLIQNRHFKQRSKQKPV